MDEQPSVRRAFADATFQAASADFLASFGELLRAASLVERRPSVRADNPDIAYALERARWLLVSAIETVARYRAACGDLPGEAIGLSRQDTDPDKESGASAHSMTADLLECLRALERLDAKPSVSALHFRVALRAFATALVKGQQADRRDRAA